MSTPWFVHEYVKRPVVIGATWVNLDPWKTGLIAEWCGGRVEPDTELMWAPEDEERTGIKQPLQVVVPSLEGPVVAHDGDYVICGVRGEFYVCNGAIFEESYQQQKPAVAA